MKEKIYNIFISILLIIYAVTAITLVMVKNINIFFKGWWTLVLILPSLGSLLFQSKKKTSLFIFIVGVISLITSFDIISMKKCFVIIGSVAIILIGISIIFATLKIPNKKNGKDKEIPIYYAIFGLADEFISTTKFNGGRLCSIFGSVNLNLSESKIDANSTIKILSVFGSSELKLPDNIEIIASSTNILGDFTNYKKKSTAKGKKNKVYIRSISIFGSTKIR